MIRPATAADIARAQEDDTLAGIRELERLRSQPSPAVPEPPPPPPPAVTAVPGLNVDELRASGMDEVEIEALVAEMEGRPVPELPPAARILEQVEGRDAVSAALGKPVDVVGVVRAATLAPVGPPPTEEDMTGRLKAVREAKARLATAEDALKTAQVERASALEALSTAQHHAAEGFAALMT